MASPSSLIGEYLHGSRLGGANSKRFTDYNDDYAFLDEDEDLADDAVMGARANSLRWNRWEDFLRDLCDRQN